MEAAVLTPIDGPRLARFVRRVGSTDPSTTNKFIHTSPSHRFLFVRPLFDRTMVWLQALDERYTGSGKVEERAKNFPDFSR